jgi:hypothetical protein
MAKRIGTADFEAVVRQGLEAPAGSPTKLQRERATVALVLGRYLDENKNLPAVVVRRHRAQVMEMHADAVPEAQLEANDEWCAIGLAGAFNQSLAERAARFAVALREIPVLAAEIDEVSGRIFSMERT